MTEAFVTYEQAILLKKLGYPQPIRGQGPTPDVCPVWVLWDEGTTGDYSLEDMVHVGFSCEYCAAPTYLQAFEWLAQEKGWWIHLKLFNPSTFYTQLAGKDSPAIEVDGETILELLTTVLKKELVTYP